MWRLKFPPNFPRVLSPTCMNCREDGERDEEGEEHVEALREALDEHGPVE